MAVVDKFGDLFADMDAQVLGPVRPRLTDDEIVGKELTDYINEPRLERLNNLNMPINPLEWWAQHEGKYPTVFARPKCIVHTRNVSAN